MDSELKQQLGSALFLRTFEITDMIAANEDIFSDPPTIDDYESLFHYVFALFVVHNRTHENKIGEDIFDAALAEFYISLVEKNLLAKDDARERLIKAAESINLFFNDHVEFLSTSNDSDGLMQYVSSVLSKIPSCRGRNAYSLAGVTFASILPQIIDTIGQSYAALISDQERANTDDVSEWEKTFAEDDEPVDRPAADAQSAQLAPSEPSAPQKKKLSTFNIACIAALVLCVLVIAELYQQNSALYQKNADLTEDASRWHDKYMEKTKDCNEIRAEYNEIYEEYNFFHNRAVIVTESGSRYHIYDCYHWDYPIWIYNYEAAASRGYTPCMDCSPPQ